MRLLIATQKVDLHDENLGSFHRWIEEFSRHYASVVVIANSIGEARLPSNVVLHSLGRERGVSRIKKIWKFWELFSFYYAHSDAVLFHMIPEFVLLAAPFLVSLKKPSALWYTHKSVTWKLKLAERLVNYVFTASELSFRLPSKKVLHTGHAIDTETFTPLEISRLKAAAAAPTEGGFLTGLKLAHSGGTKILTLGRISPVKDYETIIRAAAILASTWHDSWLLSIVGGPIMRRDEDYFQKLKKMVRDLGLEKYVVFQGSRPFTEVPQIYHEHDMFISMSTTGSIDRAVLEAASSGLTVVTSNEAFADLLKPLYYLERRSPEFLAERIKVLARENRPNLALRELVLKDHSLERTIAKIVKHLQEAV